MKEGRRALSSPVRWGVGELSKKCIVLGVNEQVCCSPLEVEMNSLNIGFVHTYLLLFTCVSSYLIWSSILWECSTVKRGYILMEGSILIEWGERGYIL